MSRRRRRRRIINPTGSGSPLLRLVWSRLWSDYSRAERRIALFNIAFNWRSTNRQEIAGVSPEQLTALIRQHAEHSETQKKLISRLETELDLNRHQIRTALDILGETNVVPERLATK